MLRSYEYRPVTSYFCRYMVLLQCGGVPELPNVMQPALST